MTLDEITRSAINPVLQLLPPAMDSHEARVMLLAIGLQESRFAHRRQIVGDKPVGPAKSFWQGERGGGMVRGVRTHAATQQHAHVLYRLRGVQPLDTAIWNAIEHDDVLAAGLARLLLWSDPFRLPGLGNAAGAWELYTRTWRPGKPHPATWPRFYMQALEYVLAASRGKDL